MLSTFLFLTLYTFCQANAEAESPAWPLFEFWNPLTWLNPKFSSETMFHILRARGESNRKMFQQLKKALLPANLFFGNIRAQYVAWDSGRGKRLETVKDLDDRTIKNSIKTHWLEKTNDQKKILQETFKKDKSPKLEKIYSKKN